MEHSKAKILITTQLFMWQKDIEVLEKLEYIAHLAWLIKINE